MILLIDGEPLGRERVKGDTVFWVNLDVINTFTLRGSYWRVKSSGIKQSKISGISECERVNYVKLWTQLKRLHLFAC